VALKSAFYQQCFAPIQSEKTTIDCHLTAIAAFFQDMAAGMRHPIFQSKGKRAHPFAAILSRR
jgi:hypothetical protein